MSSTGVRVPPRRRNGKHQACEPCRKAKVACDHTLPICRRCQKRKWAERCIYLDAPMTKGIGERETEADEWSVESIGVISSALSNEAHTSPTTPETSHIAPRSTVNLGLKPKSTCTSYFGPTAFSSIFDENQADLGNDIQITNDREPGMIPSEELGSYAYIILGNESRCAPRVSLGINVLRALPDQNTCKFLLTYYTERFSKCFFYRPSIVNFIDSLWAIHGKQLKEPRRHKDLEAVSRRLCVNAETSVGYESEAYDDWILSFSGQNLRWESIGTVFTALICALLTLPERDAFFSTQKGNRTNRKRYAMELKDCVQACITLSGYMDNLNVLMVALLAKNFVITTVLSGDTSLLVWRQLGDLVSAATALGLHRDKGIDKPITFLSEFRRCIFNIVFRADKGASLLTGRPPALSYRYCKFKIPLDLKEEDFASQAILDRAVANLDPGGWNTEGIITRSSKDRALSMFAVVTDEILEVSLGDFGACTDRIKYLSDRVDQTYASFPEHLRWNLSMLNSDIDDGDCFQIIGVRLHTLELKVLLSRMSYKHNLQNGQELVDCAHEELELVVSLWVKRDRFIVHHHDYDWVLMVFGVPAAGVLCVELLKQMRAEPGTYKLQLPRSAIVQNLSLLIGFFEWVQPAAGNYNLCMRMRDIIRRILDQILDPPSLQPILAEQVSLVQQLPSEGEAGQSLDVEDDLGMGLDDLTWLDDIDWSRGPWIDLGGQDYTPARWS